MTLRIITSGCENPDRFNVECKEDGYEYTDLDYVTKAIGFTMNYVGIGRITKANVDEVFRRFQLAESVIGPCMYQGGKPQLFTLEDVEQRIGLITNTIPYGKREFNRKIKEEEKRK